MDGLKCVQYTSQFNNDYKENCKGDSDEGHFLEVYVNILKNCIIFTMIYRFLPERMSILKVEKLLANLHDKEIHYTYKKFKPRTKSWISINKNVY